MQDFFMLRKIMIAPLSAFVVAYQ